MTLALIALALYTVIHVYRSNKRKDELNKEIKDIWDKFYEIGPWGNMTCGSEGARAFNPDGTTIPYIKPAVGKNKGKNARGKVVKKKSK